jgi:uncharacterized protein
MPLQLNVDTEHIATFCRKWRVRELSIFGSALRQDFRADSDVDVLIELDSNAHLDIDIWLDMLDDLAVIFGRQVDLVEKQSLRNPFRRHEILTSRKVIYEA